MSDDASRYAKYAAVYGLVGGDLPTTEELTFRQWTASPRHVFYRSASGLSYATVFRNPRGPGHVLVISTRRVPRLQDLTWVELEDLWMSVRQVVAIVTAADGNAADIAAPDGPDAGQTIPHVHVHIVVRAPRPKGAMGKGKKVTAGDPGDRVSDQIAVEANRLAEYALENGLAGSELPVTELVFGQYKMQPSQIFYRSASGLSLGLVNSHERAAPGHMLVVTASKVATIGELTAAELEDLWVTVRMVLSIVKGAVGTTAAEIAVQDGPGAGQSVPHVHVHILPRGGTRPAINPKITRCFNGVCDLGRGEAPWG